MRIPQALREHVTSEGVPKRAFATIEDARAYAATLKGSKRRPYHGYECGLCHHFHVGRRPAKGVAARRARAG